MAPPFNTSSLANGAALAVLPGFRNLCLVALVAVARSVLVEPEGTANHVLRYSFARSVIMDPLAYADSVTWVMAADTEISNLGDQVNKIKEDVLLARINVTWDYLSSIAD